MARFYFISLLTATVPKPFILIAINEKQLHRHDELFNNGVLIYESESNITGKFESWIKRGHLRGHC